MAGKTGVRRTCKAPKCRRQFTPRRGTRREYCFTCRPEKSPGGPATAPPAGGTTTSSLPTNGDMAAAVAAELARIGKAGSLQGAVAMRLARVLDDPQLGAAQVASLSDKLLRIMEPLIKAGPHEPDEVDEFTARFEAMAAAAS